MREFCSKWTRHRLICILLALGPVACQVREADLPTPIPQQEDNFLALATALSEFRNDYGVRIQWGAPRPERLIKEWEAKEASGRPVLFSRGLTPLAGKDFLIDSEVTPDQRYLYYPKKKDGEDPYRPEQMEVTIPNDLLISLDTIAGSFEKSHPVHGFNSNRRMYVVPNEKMVWPAGRLELKTHRLYFDHHYSKEAPNAPNQIAQILLSRTDNALEKRIKESRPGTLVNFKNILGFSTSLNIGASEARGILSIHIDPSFNKDQRVSLNISVYDPRDFSLKITSEAPPEAFDMQWINLGSQAYLIEKEGLVAVQSHAGLFRRRNVGTPQFKLVTYTGQYYDFDIAEGGRLVMRGSEPLRSPLQLPSDDFEKLDVDKGDASIPATLIESARMNQRCFELSEIFAKEGLTVILRASGTNPFTANQVKLLERIAAAPEEIMKLMKESETTELEVSNEKVTSHPTVKNIRISVDLGISSETEQEYKIALERLRQAAF